MFANLMQFPDKNVARAFQTFCLVNLEHAEEIMTELNIHIVNIRTRF